MSQMPTSSYLFLPVFHVADDRLFCLHIPGERLAGVLYVPSGGGKAHQMWVCLSCVFTVKKSHFLFLGYVSVLLPAFLSLHYFLSHSWTICSSDTTRTAPFNSVLALRAPSHWPCTQSKNAYGWGGPTLTTPTLALRAEQHPDPKNHWTQTTAGEWLRINWT